MRTPLVLAAAIALIGAATLPARAAQTAAAGVTPIPAYEAISAAKRKKRVRGYQAYGTGRPQIACTQYGCNPIPRGCQVVPGRNPFTWDPSGFDEVACPYYR